MIVASTIHQQPASQLLQPTEVDRMRGLGRSRWICRAIEKLFITCQCTVYAVYAVHTVYQDPHWSNNSCATAKFL